MDVEFLKNKFEDGYDGVVTKTKFTIGVRHLQIVYMVVCTAVMGAMRGSGAIAVLAIADHSRQNDTYIQIHAWDSRIRGSILSSFLFGYALLLPAGVSLRRLGDKSILTAVLLINGGLCAAMPTVVNKGGWVAVCNAQFLMGMTQACVSPVNQILLARWLPPVERAVLGYLVDGGMLLGIIIALPVSGMLSEARLGWELVFYSQAMLTLSMAGVWALLTAGSPDTHHAVGDGEKEHIREALATCRKKRLRRPWRGILRSPQFWGVASAHAATNAVFLLYLVEVPEYLLTLGLTLKESTWQCMFPFIAMWAVYLVATPTIDWVYSIGFVGFILDLKYFRKIINSLGAISMVIGLAVLPSLTNEWGLLGQLVLAGTLGALGLQFAGFLESIRELTQTFPGSVLMMSSFVSGLVGAAVPFACGLVLGDAPEPARWRIIFYAMAAFGLVCNVAYTALGSGDSLPWEGAARDKFGYNNDVSQVEMEDRCGDEETRIMAQKLEHETAI